MNQRKYEFNTSERVELTEIRPVSYTARPAASEPLPIERALKTDLVTVLVACQVLYSILIPIEKGRHLFGIFSLKVGISCKLVFGRQEKKEWSRGPVLSYLAQSYFGQTGDGGDRTTTYLIINTLSLLLLLVIVWGA